MRARLPFALAVLTMMFALVAGGCGDDKESSTATPAGATQSTPSGSTAGATGSNGSATASADSAHEACVAAAENLPDESARSDAKGRCDDAYENIKEGAENIDQKASDARAQCEEAANQIPDADTKANALAACARFN